jgi:hypothetical protein
MVAESIKANNGFALTSYGIPFALAGYGKLPRPTNITFALDGGENHQGQKYRYSLLPAIGNYQGQRTYFCS